MSCTVVTFVLVGPATRATSEEIQLTDHGADETGPVWSPDGQQIVFMSTRTGNQDIWVMPAEGGEPTQLTFHPAPDLSPRWSPDGSMIVFDSRRAVGTSDVFIMPATGGTPVRLTTNTEADFDADWSPDGSTIAFISWRADRSSIWLMPATGGESAGITELHEWHTSFSPRWSPDGTRIAFQANFPTYLDQPEILVIPATGGTHRSVSLHPGHDGSPSWSPDGEWLAFYSDRGGVFEIWMAPVSGGEAVRLTSGTADENPSWSPDGTRVVFESWRSGNSDIWAVTVPTAVSSESLTNVKLRYR
jgi:TolB protein